MKALSGILGFAFLLECLMEAGGVAYFFKHGNTSRLPNSFFGWTIAILSLFVIVAVYSAITKVTKRLAVEEPDNQQAD